MTTATYLGSFDFTDEDVPDDMRRSIALFQLLRPVGANPIGTVIAFEDLFPDPAFALDTLKPGDTV